MTAGRFFSFEGVEGAGKSTQIERLAARLRGLGRTVHCCREPGGTPLGEAVRGILLDPRSAIEPAAEALLFAAIRAQLVSTVIRPALGRGEVVLCDRFVHSSLAYQGGGRGLGRDLVWRVNADAVANTLPDVVLVLDLPADQALPRARRRGAADRIEQLDLDFHLRVARAFHEEARRDPERVRLVDAEGTSDEVGGRIWAAVRDSLGEA
jgi:dTMP kinase